MRVAEVEDDRLSVFHHGWPLSADDWDNRMMFFLDKGSG
jgi:non-heme chloroperoxidase